MDSVGGHRKCGDYAMSSSAHRYGLSETLPTPHDLFLNVLGNQSSHFDQL